MVNGDCTIGAKNEANIKNLQKEQETQNKCIDKVAGKVDKLLYLVIATLGGVVVQLIIQFIGG